MDQRATRINGYYVGLIPGKRIPSVTTVIGRVKKKDSKELEYWRKKNGNWREMLAKMTFDGTLMHYRILGKMADAPLELQEGMENVEWTDEIIAEQTARREQWETLCVKPLRPRRVEHTTFMGGEYASAGTMDYCGRIEVYGTDAGNCIMDLKSSAKPRKEHIIQIGAYALMEGLKGNIIDIGLIPYVRRDSAEIVVIEQDELEEAGLVYLEYVKKFYRMQGKKD